MRTPTIRESLLTLALLLLVPATGQAAEPATAAKPPEPAAARQAPEPATAAKPEPAATEKPKAPAPTEAAKADPEKPAFIDRDGDGIQDGQEHRFRRKRDGTGRGRENGGRQFRYRGGADSGEQGQHGKGKGGP